MANFETLLYAVSEVNNWVVPLAVLPSAHECGVRMLDYSTAGWMLFCEESRVLSESLIPQPRPEDLR